MRKLLAILVLTVLALQCVVAQDQQKRLEGHLYYLASDAMRGREAGSADALKAAQYVKEEFRKMGLSPWMECYEQPFMVKQSQGKCRNIVGVIEGSDPQLKQEYIVLGAHYDHLGTKADGTVYNGADDNASGTAAIIEVARQLLSHRAELKRSVIICAFDAEEIGLHGSNIMANCMDVMAPNRVRMMMSIDMVGWLRQGGALRLMGTGTLKGCSDMLDEVAALTGIKIATRGFESSPFTATDTEPFARRGIPTLAVTTGLKSPYHKPEDDPELIDYPGLSKVVDYLAALTLRMASDKEAMEPTGRVAAKHSSCRRFFEAGPMVGFNTSAISFPYAAFDGKAMYGWQGGIATRMNFGRFVALGIDAVYDLKRSAYPYEADLYNGSLTYRRESLLVPATLIIHLGKPSMSFDLGVGGYYGYAFSTSLPVCTDFPQHQYGWQWGFGFSAGPLFWHLRCYYQQSPLFGDAAMPNTEHHSVTWTLGWLF